MCVTACGVLAPHSQCRVSEPQFPCLQRVRGALQFSAEVQRPQCTRRPGTRSCPPPHARPPATSPHLLCAWAEPLACVRGSADTCDTPAKPAPGPGTARLPTAPTLSQIDLKVQVSTNPLFKAIQAFSTILLKILPASADCPVPKPLPHF